MAAAIPETMLRVDDWEVGFDDWFRPRLEPTTVPIPMLQAMA
jgi:hypothetical protein